MVGVRPVSLGIEFGCEKAFCFSDFGVKHEKQALRDSTSEAGNELP